MLRQWGALSRACVVPSVRKATRFPRVLRQQTRSIFGDFVKEEEEVDEDLMPPEDETDYFANFDMGKGAPAPAKSMLELLEDRYGEGVTVEDIKRMNQPDIKLKKGERFLPMDLRHEALKRSEKFEDYPQELLESLVAEAFTSHDIDNKRAPDMWERKQVFREHLKRRKQPRYHKNPDTVYEENVGPGSKDEGWDAFDPLVDYDGMLADSSERRVGMDHSGTDLPPMTGYDSEMATRALAEGELGTRTMPEVAQAMKFTKKSDRDKYRREALPFFRTEEHDAKLRELEDKRAKMWEDRGFTGAAEEFAVARAADNLMRAQKGQEEIAAQLSKMTKALLTLPDKGPNGEPVDVDEDGAVFYLNEAGEKTYYQPPALDKQDEEDEWTSVLGADVRDGKSLQAKLMDADKAPAGGEQALDWDNGGGEQALEWDNSEDSDGLALGEGLVEEDSDDVLEEHVSVDRYKSHTFAGLMGRDHESEELEQPEEEEGEGFPDLPTDETDHSEDAVDVDSDMELPKNAMEMADPMPDGEDTDDIVMKIVERGGWEDLDYVLENNPDFADRYFAADDDIEAAAAQGRYDPMALDSVPPPVANLPDADPVTERLRNLIYKMHVLDPVENNTRALSRKFKLRLVTIRGVLRLKAIEHRMDRLGFQEFVANFKYPSNTQGDKDDFLDPELIRRRKEGDWGTTNADFDHLMEGGGRYYTPENEDRQENSDAEEGVHYRWNKDMEDFDFVPDDDFDIEERWSDRYGTEPVDFAAESFRADPQYTNNMEELFKQVPKSLVELMKANGKSPDPVRPPYEGEPVTDELGMTRTVYRLMGYLVAPPDQSPIQAASLKEAQKVADKAAEQQETEVSSSDEGLEVSPEEEGLEVSIGSEQQVVEEDASGQKTYVSADQQMPEFFFVNPTDEQFLEDVAKFEALPSESQTKLFRLALMNYYDSPSYWLNYRADKEGEKLAEAAKTINEHFEDARDDSMHDAINDWTARKYDAPRADIVLADEADYDRLHREDQKIFNRFASRAEKLEEIEKAQAARDGPIGASDAKPTVDLLSPDLQSPNHYNIVMLDLSDSKNDNYSIAVRDTAGRLRGPFPKEFARVKQLEKGYEYARFNYLKWNPLDKHHNVSGPQV